MKCIKKDSKVMRVPEEVAKKNVLAGWVYCPKHEFKKSSDKEVVHKPQPIITEKPKKYKKNSNKKQEVDNNMDEIDKLINKKD